MVWLACVICPIITGMFVMLRAYARIFITKKLSVSDCKKPLPICDWCRRRHDTDIVKGVSFTTLVWIIAFSVTLAQATYSGMGRHKKDFTKDLTEGMEFWILV